MAENFTKRLKTLWEKQKLLIMSNFLFSLSVFKRLVLQTRKNQGLFGKGLSKKVKGPRSNHIKSTCTSKNKHYTSDIIAFVICKCFNFGQVKKICV